MLDRVDGFPKNQRFVLGTRLADAVVRVVELLGEAAYAAKGRKRELLDEANRKIEVVRWLVRVVTDRGLISRRQFLHCTVRGLNLSVDGILLFSAFPVQTERESFPRSRRLRTLDLKDQAMGG